MEDLHCIFSVAAAYTRLLGLLFPIHPSIYLSKLTDWLLNIHSASLSSKREGAVLSPVVSQRPVRPSMILYPVWEWEGGAFVDGMHESSTSPLLPQPSSILHNTQSHAYIVAFYYIHSRAPRAPIGFGGALTLTQYLLGMHTHKVMPPCKPALRTL